MRYVALLRGINVGKANRVKMSDLLSAISRHEISSSTAYLQSGNILFDTNQRKDEAEQSIAAALQGLGLRSTVILRTAREMSEIAKRDPFKDSPGPGKSQFVTFCKHPIDGTYEAGEASEIITRTESEIFWIATPREGKAPTGPKLPKNVLTETTNRNWIVTLALAELLEVA
ncbi:MAG TPA: DUF1697 domain-containing protein [Fimbriimonadaceae bacterium]|nr:DUF1697 domain-containing protein [Fimbriimonadaceae bacterium]